MSGFSFNFDKAKEAIEFTTADQRFLEVITRRISGVKSSVGYEDNIITQEEADFEVERLEAAFADVKKRMSKAEFAEYEVVVEAHNSKELTKEEIAARNKEMDKNKDRPSH